MSDSVQPHRWQPTRLPPPWDSPGKNPGVGCHFFLQSMKVKSESEVDQSCPTHSNPMDCSLPGSSVHGISGVRCHCLLQYAELGAVKVKELGMFRPAHHSLYHFCSSLFSGKRKEKSHSSFFSFSLRQYHVG